MKCVLHIGTEKTGTTLIQNWLYLNRSRLSQQGVAQTVSAGTPNNRMLVAYFQSHFDEFFRFNRIRTWAERDSFFARFEETFRSEIETLAQEHDRVILTSEHFHSRLIQQDDILKVAAFLKPMFSELKILCYFREQSEVRKSLYSTALRDGNALPLEEFQKNTGVGDHYYNYNLMFSKWDRAFGRDALMPVIYDRARFPEGDIRHDFLARAAPEVDPGGLEFEMPKMNESFARFQATFARAINAAQPVFQADQYNTLRSRSVQIVERSESLRSVPLRDGRQRQFHDMFSVANEKFSEKFFGRKENPFPKVDGSDPDEDGPCLSLKEFDEIVVPAIERLFSMNGLVQLEGNEIDRLRDLAVRLYGSDDGKEDALLLMRIAQRARPTGGKIRAQLAAWEKDGT